MFLRVLNKSCVMYILLMSVWNKAVTDLNTEMMNPETDFRLQKLSQLNADIVTIVSCKCILRYLTP